MGQNVSSLCHSCMTKPREDELLLISNDPPENVKKDEIVNGFNLAHVNEKLEEAEKEYLEMIREGLDGGNCIVEIDKPDVKVSGKETEKGYVVKYQFCMPFTPDEFFNLVDFPAKKAKWDSSVKLSEEVMKTDNFSAVHTIYKGAFPISARDVLLVCRKFKDGKNWCDLSTSVESENYPVDKDVVRMQIFAGGYYLEPMEKDENGNITKVTSVSHINVGLPPAMSKAVRKFATSQIPKFGKNLIKAIEKEKEETQNKDNSQHP
ncbi:unnamed protein product [Blepharisma stoltei]|uniref:START domain-containing protein n=1 Tax=Blepharisma stoltei TaxID=1481888 RepID=A0AAU9JK74_9CILI|nr:unnamed protein product [Blepharisma stoltei]